MATLSSDKTYVTVVKGDTLSEIARDYKSYTGGATYQQLAAINGIPNPDLIYIGQRVYFKNSGSSSSSTSSNAVILKHFGMQSNSDSALFVTWEWSKSNTENYKVQWEYSTGDGIWFIGNESTTEHKQSIYNVPFNAIKVRVKVKPISKTYTKNNKETSYWTASWSGYKTWDDTTPFTTPAAPEIEIEKFKLTASLNNIDNDDGSAAGVVEFAYIEFEVVANDNKVYKTGKAAIKTDAASYTFTIEAGNEYKVRCRAYNSKQKKYSEWSPYTSNYGTIPAAPSDITSLKALSSTSIYISWSSVKSTDNYTVQYTTKQTYFDSNPNEVKSSTVESTVTHAELTGLESGQQYFFRVRAVNKDGESSWTSVKSITIGKKPSAPTTWSSTTTATVGNKVNLYWVHNTVDGSSETFAEVEITVNGSTQTYTIKNTETDEDLKDRTKVYTIDTTPYYEGVKIKWRVRTCGITNTFGDWSVQREIDVYAPPVLTVEVTDANKNPLSTLTSFPFYIYALAGPNTQVPIGYHLSIISNEKYETVDNIGNVKMVNEGEAVYSKYFDTTDALLVILTPSNVNLDNNISYTVKCTVTMNSGLTADASYNFDVKWKDEFYSLNAEIGYDEETFVTHIRPYCEDMTMTRYQVTKSGTKYTRTSTEITQGVYGTKLNNVKTDFGDDVYSGVTADGESIYYCEVYKYGVVENVTLSVYRREFDGTFTEIATGLKNTKNTYVTDPHPSLDYARYRVVAIADDTGAVSFYDVPGYPIGETAIIIQWDEDWTEFDTTDNGKLQEQPWTGSLLRLPYNVDVSDSNNPDVTLVKYIGRSQPVSYYGTHIDSTATWNVEIERNDKDTLYALRRLAIWMGDVYVREPSGSGYWANIKVTFSQKHCDVTIPVTLSITRVEGGM